MAKALDERARQRAAAVLDRSTGGRVPLGPGSRPTGIGRAGFGLGAALVAALTLASCAGDSTAAGPAATTELPASTTSTTAAPTPTTAVPSPEDELRLAYIGYVNAFRASNDPPDPEYPGLAEYTTGTALARAKEVANENAQIGFVYRQPAGSVFAPVLLTFEVTTGVAKADVCVVDDGLVVQAVSRRVLNDRILTQRWDVGFARVGDRWKVDSVNLVREDEGVVPCV